MNKKLLILFPIAGVIGLTLMSNTNENFESYHVDSFDEIMHNSSSNILPGLTGAPGESNCTECHSGSVLDVNATNGMTTTATTYQVGETYSFAIGSTTNTSNGFQMTVLDNSGIKAGSFVSGVANTAIQTNGGKEYINQTSKTQNWIVEWTAPSTDMGPLTVYYALNTTNNNGNNGGDEVFVGNHSLASDITNGLTNHQKQDTKVNLFFNENDNELNVKYALNKKANVMVQIVDLSGKVIEEVKLGQKSFGPHSTKIHLENIRIEGIYIVSLFINNGIYTRKIKLK